MAEPGRTLLEGCPLTKEHSVAGVGRETHACCILCRLEKHFAFSVGTIKHHTLQLGQREAQEVPGFREEPHSIFSQDP